VAAILQRPSAPGAFLRGTAPRIAALILVALISSGLAACLSVMIFP
jgi:hypothetical protein